MIRLVWLLLAVTVGGCISIADPASIRAPQSAQEQADYAAAAKRVEPVMNALALRNQDVCALPCRLDINMGVANGSGAFADRTHVWLPVPMVVETRSADELALVIGHEWAHTILDDPGGFDAYRELRADCVGAILTKKAGFDPRRGADIYRRWAKREAVEQVLLLAVGMIGGNAKQPWIDRLSIIERAVATDGSKAAIKQVCRVSF